MKEGNWELRGRSTGSRGGFLALIVLEMIFMRMALRPRTDAKITNPEQKEDSPSSLDILLSSSREWITTTFNLWRYSPKVPRTTIGIEKGKVGKQ